MATLRKGVFLVSVWGLMFAAGFSLFNSRSEEEVLRFYKALESSKAWFSFASQQTLWLDGNEKPQLSVSLISQQDPYLAWAKTSTVLTETEDFEFEVYFRPDLIYLHMKNGDSWHYTDYTDPVAGELRGLKDPFSFWERLVKHVERVERIEGDPYRLKMDLKPFKDEVHSILLEDLTRAQIVAHLSKEPLGIEKIRLTAEAKRSVTRIYHRLEYEASFSDINRSFPLELPPEANRAKPLREK